LDLLCGVRRAAPIETDIVAFVAYGELATFVFVSFIQNGCPWRLSYRTSDFKLTFKSRGQTHNKTSNLILTSWSIDMRSEVARRSTISVEFVQLSTNAKPLRTDTRQQELGDDVDDASFIGAEVGREFSGIELDRLAVLFVIDVFSFAVFIGAVRYTRASS